jgi:hypothetical protein
MGKSIGGAVRLVSSSGRGNTQHGSTQGRQVYELQVEREEQKRRRVERQH